MPEFLPNWKTSDIRTLRRFSEISLVVVDLDGTLIRHGESLPYHKIVRLWKNLHHNRYQVALTIATGRTLSGVKQLLKALFLPRNTPLILYNGGLVVANGGFEILYRRTLQNETLHKIIQTAFEYETYVLAYYVQGPSLAFNEQPYEYIIGWSTPGVIRPSHDFNRIQIEWREKTLIGENVFPTAILVVAANHEKDKGQIKSKLANLIDLSIAESGAPNYIEIRPKGVNKGTALKRISRYLNMSSQQILALGDNDNDAEMLGWAGIGIAIGGATTLATANSDYVCSYDAARGAVEVLTLVKQARRYFFDPRKRIDTSSKTQSHETE